MRFTYCPDCGMKLSSRVLGDEGAVPWCDGCGRPFFDMFSSCVIVLVVNDREEAAVLMQDHLSAKYGTLVSGYIKPGESAEDCARRETEEELGLQLKELSIQKTWWHGKRNQLMIGFVGRAKKAEFRLSGEVDSVQWIPVAEAPALMHPGKSISTELVRRYLEEREK